MKPAGSHSASSPFKHKPYYKKAKYVSISLDHRLLLTKNTFYSVLLNILECIKIAEIHEKSHSWLAVSSAGGQGGGSGQKAGLLPLSSDSGSPGASVLSTETLLAPCSSSLSSCLNNQPHIPIPPTLRLCLSCCSSLNQSSTCNLSNCLEPAGHG